jgi:hypothetical protein
MIEIPTCLVLGAGASVPYGFPSGIDLRKRILENFTNKRWHDFFSELRFDDENFEDEDFIASFHSDFNISKILSIDRFLELHPDYLNIGKLAIAFALVPLEDRHNLLEIDDPPDRWYSQLWNKLLIQNVNQLHLNKLKIITFNYDRSLEYFIYNAIKGSYPKATENNCATFLNMLDIFHIYGKLGNLPWQGEPSRPYSPATSHQYKIARDQIKIVSEQVPKYDVFNDLLQYLSEAQRIFFLGFGFDETNFQRLRMESVPEKEKKDIRGTAFLLGKAERESLQSKWKYLKLAPNNLDISQFFKEEITLE